MRGNTMKMLSNIYYAGEDTVRKHANDRKRWLFVVSIVFILTSPIQGAILQTEMNPANGHTYYLLDLERDSLNIWTKMETAAINLGGHLVTLNDAAEEAWIDATFTPTVNEAFFIGLNDVEIEGTFVWASGEPVTYTNWQPGEPNNSGGAENWVKKEFNGSHTGDWNDVSELRNANGLVEVNVVVPVPDPLDLIVDKTTGEMIMNAGSLATTINAYNITSKSGALDPVGWNNGNFASQATGGGLSADLDGDSDVDGGDFLLGQQQGADASFYTDFTQQFGMTGGSTLGDQWEVLADTQNQLFEAFLNGDSTIAALSGLSIGNGYDTTNGAEDLVFTHSRLGKEVEGTVIYINGSTSTATAVPEPSTLVLAMLTSLFAAVASDARHSSLKWFQAISSGKSRISQFFPLTMG
jgi:lectin-like protein